MEITERLVQQYERGDLNRDSEDGVACTALQSLYSLLQPDFERVDQGTTIMHSGIAVRGDFRGKFRMKFYMSELGLYNLQHNVTYPVGKEHNQYVVIKMSISSHPTRDEINTDYQSWTTDKQDGIIHLSPGMNPFGQMKPEDEKYRIAVYKNLIRDWKSLL